jgi:lysophospholipase L1-like esterase
LIRPPTLDSLHHYADAIYATHRKPRKQAQLFDALLRTIASDLVTDGVDGLHLTAESERKLGSAIAAKVKEMCK